MDKTFWLISAPKTREGTFNTLNHQTTEEEQLSAKNYKFQFPDLKVGTLDTLMALSDELNKIDGVVENTTRKIAQQLMDLMEIGKDKNDKVEALLVNNNEVDKYLTFFQWDKAKYPSTTPLKTLVETIQSQVGKMDEEVKAKSAEYTNLSHALMGEERKQGGNLLIRDLADVVQKQHLIDESEFMEALFVAVPKTGKNFISEYEKLAKWVVPRSAELVAEDNEYQLFRVIVFKQSLDEFKHAARDKKYIVRDFVYNPNYNPKEDRKKMEAQKDKLKKDLIRWCKANFAESFIGWVHLKAIRVFVESVLRYGLPTDFEAMLLLPLKNKDRQLRKKLHNLYAHLSSKSVFGGKGETPTEEEDENFYPYVFLEVNLDFRKQI